MLGRRTFASCAICAAIGLAADDASAQAPSGVKRTITSRRDGPAEGYETVELIIELDPKLETGWVIHPGTEGGVILEGGGELLIKGEPTVISKPGTSWVLAAEAPHNLRNGPQATKLALTLTVQKGKPLTIEVPAPT
jgi:quercetin dioxygenase-like cupin family protein